MNKAIGNAIVANKVGNAKPYNKCCQHFYKSLLEIVYLIDIIYVIPELIVLVLDVTVVAVFGVVVG